MGPYRPWGQVASTNQPSGPKVHDHEGYRGSIPRIRIMVLGRSGSGTSFCATVSHGFVCQFGGIDEDAHLHGILLGLFFGLQGV